MSKLRRPLLGGFLAGLVVGALAVAAVVAAGSILLGTDDDNAAPTNNELTVSDDDRTTVAVTTEVASSSPPDDDVTAEGTDPTDGSVPPAGTPEVVGAVPEPFPNDRAVVCPPVTISVRTADDLTAALDAAEPGDVIGLTPGTYVGKFVATRPGKQDKPIFLCGPKEAVIDGDGIKGGYVMHLDGVSDWRLVGFTVRNGQKGVIADRVTRSVIQELTVTHIGDEGIHLRSGSTSNVVIGNTVSETGLRRDKFGEGIYIGSAQSNWTEHSGGGPDRSDFNLIQANTISRTGSESIDIKEGTTAGRVTGNRLDGSGMTGADSLIDVKGNGWLIDANIGVHAIQTIQTHRILDGWGTENVIRANTLDVDGRDLHIYIHDPEITANILGCDNRTGSGDATRSNVPCAS